MDANKDGEDLDKLGQTNVKADALAKTI